MKENLKQIHSTLAFLRSVILSGEPITDYVRDAINEAIENVDYITEQNKVRVDKDLNVLVEPEQFSNWNESSPKHVSTDPVGLARVKWWDNCKAYQQAETITKDELIERLTKKLKKTESQSNIWMKSNKMNISSLKKANDRIKILEMELSNFR